MYFVSVAHGVHLAFYITLGIIYDDKMRRWKWWWFTLRRQRSRTIIIVYYRSLIGRRERPAAVGWKRVSRERETNDRQKLRTL